MFANVGLEAVDSCNPHADYLPEDLKPKAV